MMHILVYYTYQIGAKLWHIFFSLFVRAECIDERTNESVMYVYQNTNRHVDFRYLLNNDQRRKEI